MRSTSRLLYVAAVCAAVAVTHSSALHLSFWDNNVTETAAFTTFDFLGSDANTLIANKAAKVSNLMYVFWDFIETTPTGYVLKEDWAARWKNSSDTAKPLLANGTIFGFFLGDELVWNGLNMSALNLMVKTVRDDFPQATVWYNEAVPPMRDGVDVYGNQHNYSIPSGLSWISIDMYHTGGPSASFVHDYVQAFYEQYVYTKMTSEQQVVLVPGSFSSNVNPACNTACYDTMCSLDANNFFSWARADRRVAAIAPWHWGDCASCQRFKNEIGTAKTNETRKTWEAIGRTIKGNLKSSVGI